MMRSWTHARDIRDELLGQGQRPLPLEDLLLHPEEAGTALAAFPTIRVLKETTGLLDLEATPPPVIDRNMDLLRAFLVESAVLGHTTLILCDNDGQVQRLEEILREKGVPSGSHLGIGALEGGFLLETPT